MTFFYPPYIPRPFYPNYDNHKETENNNDNNRSKNNSDNHNYDNNFVDTPNKEKSSRYSSFGPVRFKNPLFDDDINEPIFEIFGIDLYLDDIIIIGLLFLLYKEGVQDELLYIALILLLIS